MSDCAGCQRNTCYQGAGCARGQELGSYTDPSKREYELAENRKILEIAARLEAEHYMQWTRLEELSEFCRQMEWHSIGIAHCVGFVTEAKMLKNYLERSLQVRALCCKFSQIDKQDYELPQVKEDRYEAICNPIGQAMFFNDQHTDLNIILGLCLGHDMLFSKYSEAPVTTFAVKDRVLGHNPLAAFSSSYYRKKFGLKV